MDHDNSYPFRSSVHHSVEWKSHSQLPYSHNTALRFTTPSTHRQCKRHYRTTHSLPRALLCGLGFLARTAWPCPPRSQQRRSATAGSLASTSDSHSRKPTRSHLTLPFPPRTMEEKYWSPHRILLYPRLLGWCLLVRSFLLLSVTN